MPDVTAAEIEQGLDGMRVVVMGWRALDGNPDMAIGTIADPHRLAKDLKAEIDSYPSFGPFFGPHNPSPLTCAGCTVARGTQSCPRRIPCLPSPRKTGTGPAPRAR